MAAALCSNGDLIYTVDKRIAIEVQGLSKFFGESRAVDDLNFTVPMGTITALLGGNGAGKTTTLSMLLGLIIPSSGGIRVLEIDMIQNRHAALGFMNFSSPYVELPHRLSVRENLLVYARLYGVKRAAQKVDDILEALNLIPYRERPSGKLSAGQKTRVALAKALINEPRVLLLDEPTASLDPDTADWVRGYLEQYQKRTEATIMLASHNMLEVERLAHDVLMMKEGKLVDQGTPQALIAKHGRETMEEVFLDIVRGATSL